ncbi:MAG TPA: hypothetical protein PKU95_03300 [Candidatus Dojkabacteria bacterium]|nr:hypothetical protein [Candidatus Dojkabacteria bacterium]
MSELAPKSAPKKSKTPFLIGCIILLLCCCSILIIAALAYFFSQPVTPDIPKLDVTTSELVELGSSAMDMEGGVLEVKEGPMAGVKLEIPQGSLESEETISISYREVENTNLPENMGLVSNILVLERTNPELMFLHPVAITIPYDVSKTKYNELVSAYEMDLETGYFDVATTISIDAENGKITFLTSHFTDFGVLELLKKVEEIVNAPIDTGFNVSRDGWFITNRGAYITPAGNCLGMSAFARQYFINYKGSSDQSFYQRLREGDKNLEVDDRIAQELSARIQLSYRDRWSVLDQDMKRYQAGVSLPMSQVQSGLSIISSLLLTGKPQVIYMDQLFKKYDSAGNFKEWGALLKSHSVLVYKYEDGFFYLYDPNFPYRESDPGRSIRKVAFNTTDGWDIYQSSLTADSNTIYYNYFLHFGTSIALKDSYLDELWEKAKGGFQDASFPTITVTSPETDAIITEKSVILEGNVTGANYLSRTDKHLYFYYPNGSDGLSVFKKKLDDNGYFEVELPVIPGNNLIGILASGSSQYEAWAGFQFVKFTSTILPSDMIITMTWDAGQSDIDLHVTDPIGNHIYYQNKSSNVGSLDFDNTSGYGPEHYTISSEAGNQMPVGDYRVQVHYYADHDSDYYSTQTVPWTVHLKWVKYLMPQTNEPVWEEQTVTGVLGAEKQYQDVYTITINPVEVQEIKNEKYPGWNL